MIAKKNLIFSLVLFCTSCAGCSATSTSVKKTYEKPGLEGGFENFLIVGVSDSRVTRRRFETAMVRSFADIRVAATSSHRVMAADIPLNRDSVAAAAAETKSDAVLVATLVSSQTKSKIKEGRGELKTKRKDENLGNFFRYDYELVRDPDSIDVKSTVVVATDVYEIQSGEKIWSVESSTFNKEGLQDLLDSMSEATVKQLKRDGLAR